jgi:hypothetical protein
MKNHDRLTSILLGTLGIYIAIEGYYLELGALNKPKPGFLVFWAGIILFGLSLLLFIQTFVSKYEITGSIWKGVKWQRGIKLNLILIGYILSFHALGFAVSTFLMLILICKSLDSQKWGTALLLSVTATLLSLLVFGYFLEVQFPRGLLKGWY